MKKQKILFEKEIYDEVSIREYIRKEVFPYVPFWSWNDMEKACDISFEPYGYVHNTGFVVRIVEHEEDREGCGWNDMEQEYKNRMAEARWRWKLADNSYRASLW